MNPTYKINFKGKGKTPEIAVKALMKAAASLGYDPKDMKNIETNQLGKTVRNRVVETYWVCTGHIIQEMEM